VHLTIERMRTMVLAAGVLLILVLVLFLTIGKWRNPFNRRDIPGRLGIEIQQESNGVTYTQAHGGHTLFKIHASKVVQLKQGNALLHDVQIELYGADGKSVDRIAGSEFEYDANAGLAKAPGAVEITVTRPGVAPAIAPPKMQTQPLENKVKAPPLAAGAATAATGEIRVKTSGLTFNWKSGVATTDQHVDFSMVQGTGSSMGASFDSQKGWLLLDHAVQLDTHRGAEAVHLQAAHAELERDDHVCRLTEAVANYPGGEARATAATIQFRDDGSASQLDAVNGLTLSTPSGGHLAAATGTLHFDEHNQPRHGHLEGGVTIDSDSQGRKVHGTSPTMEMEFTAAGVLRSAHLERGVMIASDQQIDPSRGMVPTHRTWESQVADLEFRNSLHGQLELASIHGTGRVLVTEEEQRANGSVTPSHMTADDVTGTFGADSALTELIGVGHADIEQTTPTGTRQSTSGDRLVAHFAAGPGTEPNAGGQSGKQTGGQKHAGVQKQSPPAMSSQITSATVEGNVVLMQQPLAQPGAHPGSHTGAAAPAALRATAAQAVYEGKGELLHLSGSPHIEDGGLQLAADKIDVSQASGDVFAHGNVKATWFGSESSGTANQSPATNSRPAATLGGDGPAHVIANEAQLHQATGEATFQGHARLWQQADSVAAPLIVLNRIRQTLVARATTPSDPVRVVMLSAGGVSMEKSAHSSAPSVIRVRGGDLKYSDAEHKAVLQGGAAGSVIAETGDATTTSGEVDLVLLPPGNHAGKDGAAAQVDRMTARGHVVVSSQGRRGTGEQLVYTGDSGEYVLTGTAANPPRLTDPTRGTVTGDALIFNSRDDSVSVEGDGRKTNTETTAPK
jgi:lipopolysaccharide export system protein LptA